MTCEQIAEFLSPYVDGELAPRQRSEVDGHLADCASCKEQITSVRSLKHAIARLASREETPGAVRARVEALRFVRARFSLARKPAWMAGAALFLVAILAAIAVRNAQSPGARLAKELVSDHLRWQAEVAPAEVASDDPQRVIRFFEGRVPFSPIVPHLPDARLTGARLCKIEGRRAQLLFYRCGRQTLSVFVLDHDPGDGRCRESRGSHVCSRQLGSLTVLAVGEIPAQTLEQLLREATL
ncbi:MAG: zf-HC2 domain-containing protein [Thermoanaerobaculia bacterium]